MYAFGCQKQGFTLFCCALRLIKNQNNQNSEGTAKLAVVSYKAGKVTKVEFADIDASGIYRIYNPVQTIVGDVTTSPDTVKVFMFGDLDNAATSAETVIIE